LDYRNDSAIRNIASTYISLLESIQGDLNRNDDDPIIVMFAAFLASRVDDEIAIVEFRRYLLAHHFHFYLDLNGDDISTIGLSHCIVVVRIVSRWIQNCIQNAYDGKLGNRADWGSLTLLLHDCLDLLNYCVASCRL
jgi:hypothetical protein